MTPEVRQVEDGVVAEPVEPAGGVGDDPFAGALAGLDGPSGGGDGDDAPEPGLAATLRDSRQLRQEKAVALLVGDPIPGVAG